MYAWGRGFDDFRSAGKGRHSFTDARRAYGVPDGSPPADPRAYAGRPGAAEWPIPFTFRAGDIETDSPRPLVVAIDTTGSMKEWPRIFFEKLPLLYGEAEKHLEGCAISFQLVNDYYADGPDACFQPAPFARGPALDELLSRLRPIGGGGGQATESYEVAAAWNAVRLKAPVAVMKPVFVFLGDEAPFAEVPPEVRAELGIESPRSSDAFRALQALAEVYLVRKPYQAVESSIDASIVEVWTGSIGLDPDRIVTLDDPRRVVDVILGILSVVTGRESDFVRELTSRQTVRQSRSVFTSLRGLFGRGRGGRGEGPP
ncbi:MAG: hypothetical protein HY721_13650 [Planctomycetes bacterium]|nr:hypothetical protein [Planctomycetota bacterium]